MKIHSYIITLWAFLTMLIPSPAASRLGDFDQDGVATVRDVVTLNRHLQGSVLLDSTKVSLGDLNNDGVVNQSDLPLLEAAVLNDGIAPNVPWPQLMESSPANGEGGVAITRETILRFDKPLPNNAAVETAVSATFAGETLETRKQLSPDRRTLTLFYAEHLPPSARVRVTIDGDALGGVDADGDGFRGGMGTVDYDTLSLTVVEGTSVSGRVFASNPLPGAGGLDFVNEPLAGVRIIVEGMEDTLSAVTDLMGNFKLSPCPLGEFFVHIDGRTASNGVPAGGYYPFVGKSWHSNANTDTVVGDIYLPLIQSGTLNTVSATTDTEITFPQAIQDEYPNLADAKITVAANALFADDGTRGGMVGIAPVSPDRLPGELPEGLSFPLVVTVQTDGATNFDQPAGICFPNLPGPVTGEILQPGAKSALWSFNHDTGQFEIAGSMTVSEDGLTVCTDIGVGVLAPGWHGSRPGTEIRGQSPSKAPDKDPGCKTASYFDIANLVFSVTKDVVACGAELTNAAAAFRCVTGVIGSAGDLLLKIKKMVDDTKNDPSWKRTQIGVELLNKQKGVMVSLYDCFQEVQPASIAEKALKCGQSVVGIADSFCGFTDLDPNQPERCRPTSATRYLCQKVKEAKFALAFFTTSLAKFKQVLEDWKIGLTCVLVEGVDLAFNGWPVPSAPAAQNAGGVLNNEDLDRPLTEAEIAQLQGMLAELEI